MSGQKEDGCRPAKAPEQWLDPLFGIAPSWNSTSLSNLPTLGALQSRSHSAAWCPFLALAEDVARALARDADSSGDAGTHDVVVGQVVRGNELQSWYVTRTLTGRNGSV